MLKKYGVDSNMKIPGMLEKCVKKKREKNGGAYFSEESINKRKQTCLARYGAEYHQQSVYANNGKRIYLYDEKLFDSSWELVYYIWLKNNGKEFVFHPEIRLEYTIGDKKHYYKPDFIVDGRIVEIKGDYLLKRMPKEKYECMLRNNVQILLGKDIKQILTWYRTNFSIPLSKYKYRKENT